MIMSFLGGSILFTYKVGMETKDAIVTLKAHVEHNNYAEMTGLNKWVEENNVTQQVDSYMSQAYETLLEQVRIVHEIHLRAYVTFCVIISSLFSYLLPMDVGTRC